MLVYSFYYRLQQYMSVLHQTMAVLEIKVNTISHEYKLLHGHWRRCDCFRSLYRMVYCKCFRLYSTKIGTYHIWIYVYDLNDFDSTRYFTLKYRLYYKQFAINANKPNVSSNLVGDSLNRRQNYEKQIKPNNIFKSNYLRTKCKTQRIG